MSNVWLDKIAGIYKIQKDQIDYTVNIDDKRRLVYFETPKVACTSIKLLMQDMLNSGESTKNFNPDHLHNRSMSPLKRLSNVDEDIQNECLWGNFSRFSFVRNPFTRVLSAYLDKVLATYENLEVGDIEVVRNRRLTSLGLNPDREVSFQFFLEHLSDSKSFFEDLHFTPLYRLLFVDHINYDFIGRFERFEQDLEVVKTKFYGGQKEESDASLGKFHQTKASRTFKEFFGRREVDLVQTIYERDFAEFKYSLDPLDALK
jgi:sulfotransferase famil protein